MTRHQKTQVLKTEKPEMKAKTESPALPAAQPPETLAQLDADVAALAAEARELTEEFRVGDDLRFKKGKWTKTLLGTDEEIRIGPTDTFAVDVLSYKRGWIEWRNRKPVRKLIARPVDGFVSPMRSRLPDNDKSKWPRDEKGTPQDPWQENFIVVMRHLTDGRLCTLTLTGWYGPKALGALLKIYARDQKKHAGGAGVIRNKGVADLRRC
jgi:hypothetical protein